MTAIVTQGNAASLQLPDQSVDLVVTSPPYYGLRSYTDGGVHLPGQIGAEDTPGKYLDALLECTTEWVRVLKPGGSLFVNLGDRYRSGNSGQSGMARLGEQYRGGGHTQAKAKQRSGRAPGMPPKSLLGLPWRYAIRCIDELGLILRAEIVWSKPNGLPESVTDRVRRSHEQVFHLVKSPRYYTAVDEIREATDPVNIAHHARYGGRYKGSPEDGRNDGNGRSNFQASPLGKLPGSVWSIPTAPLIVPEHVGVDHFAAFPPELVRRIVFGWSPREVCTACGEGRRPVTEQGESSWQRRRADGDPVRYGLMGNAAPLQRSLTDPADRAAGGFGKPAERRLTGYACGCPDTAAPTRPGIVLDPFGGTGTTALVASVFGRVGISVDLSADYCRLAAWRTTDEKQRAKAARPPKPSPPRRTITGPNTPGDDMTQTLQPASQAAPRPELDWERDWLGRPRILPDPAWDDVTRSKWQAGRAANDGTVPYTRVTTFAEALQDASALTRWKMRRVALGMGRRLDYVTLAAALSTRDEDKQALDDLAEKALEAAGPNAADIGTALHAFTERIDRGEELGAVPAEYEATLAAYTDKVRHLRFVDWECRTVCDELEAAGTPDRVGFCDIPDPDGVSDELRIIDTKTGRVDYSAGKFSTQLAVYAHSARYHPGTGVRTSWEEAHGAPVSTRWGLVVHVPAGAGTAELLWIDLSHGWAGAQHCAQVREWRAGAQAGSLLLPVFARPPRPTTLDGTCRGRKQDGAACGYRRKARAEGTAAQFCGRHADQARDLERWWSENPDVDPDGGVEQLPGREPVQPPAVPLEGTVLTQEEAAARTVAAALDRREALAAEERCATTGLLVSACACDVHRGGQTPEEEAAADTGPACPWCSDTGCSVCQPGRPVLEESSTDVAAQAFEHARQAVAAEAPEPARELTVGTYALDPAAEVNGNPRPVSGLQTPAQAHLAAARAETAVLQQLQLAQTEHELQTIYRQHAAAWTTELTAVAGQRSAELAQQQAREKPEAALLAALETAPDRATLTRLWSQYGAELWTPEAHVLARQRWEQVAG